MRHRSTAFIVVLIPTLLVLATVALAAWVPYTSGHSIGPLGPVADPDYEQDLLEYAEAYWEYVDSGGQTTTLFDAFVPQSDDWFGIGDDPYHQRSPFAHGLFLFEYIFEHKLQHDPTLGDIVDVRTLVEDDPVVAAAWRDWTLYHQLSTDAQVDSVAHANHLAAIQDALGAAGDWSIIGVPYYSGATLQGSAQITSENLKRKPTYVYTWPTTVTVSGCPQSTGAKIDAEKGILVSVQYLPDSEPGDPGRTPGANPMPPPWPDPGFDCDDCAEAFAHYISKDECCAACDPGCLNATVVRVDFVSASDGKPAAHMIVRVNCCGNYWLVDPQTGQSCGPYAGSTPMSAAAFIASLGYSKAGSPISTSQLQEDPEARGPGEPDSWYEDSAMDAWFASEIAGKTDAQGNPVSAADFKP